jgi:hypothetical protein
MAGGGGGGVILARKVEIGPGNMDLNYAK